VRAELERSGVEKVGRQELDGKLALYLRPKVSMTLCLAASLSAEEMAGVLSPTWGMA
jgi:hypothetical protein